MEDLILEMRNITKSFLGVRALDEVSFQLRRGEIHALIGENGAGKSTLMKVLGGVYQPDQGSILINGNEMSIRSPADSITNKIGVIYQEFNLVPTFNVAENMLLGREMTSGLTGHLKKEEMNQWASDAMAQLGIKNFNVKTKVKAMSVAMQQLVEIGKAVFNDIKILVMDEPTAVLTDNETESLFRIVEKLNQDGISIIYISHRLEEVISLCDRITVLRDGRNVETVDNRDRNVAKESLVSKMVGRELANYFPVRTTNPSGEIALEVRNLTRRNQYKDISFQVHKGEVVGLSGLVGAGRTEIVKGIFGSPSSETGEIRIENSTVSIKNPKEAMDAGIALIPEDRKREGIVLGMSLRDNLCLPIHDLISELGHINKKKRDGIVDREIASLQIRPADPVRKIRNFSGGNQQKCVIGKWLSSAPKVFILDEPTRGIDIGAKVEIYNIINKLAESGVAFVVVSSDLSELIGICDRIFVVSNGEISGEFIGPDFSQDEIMKASFNVGGEVHENV